jgi:hypothetical protein
MNEKDEVQTKAATGWRKRLIMLVNGHAKPTDEPRRKDSCPPCNNNCNEGHNCPARKP